MTRVLRLFIPLVLVTSAIVAAAPAQHAAAAGPCEPEAILEFPATQDYRVKKCGVPDFDQRRSALLNGGEEYCVPTSAIDWMSYIADHGEPSVMPGPGVVTNYAAIDNAIMNMGTYMQTNPAKGTVGDKAEQGLEDWFDASYGGRGGEYFTVDLNGGKVSSLNGGTRTMYPSPRLLGEYLASGSLVIPVFGKYEFKDGYWKRTGGHITALTSARRDRTASEFGAYVLGIHDPGGDDGDPTQQSAPHTELLGTSGIHFLNTSANDVHGLVRVYGTGYADRWLDGAYFITPKYGLFPEPNAGQNVKFKRAVSLDDGLSDRVVGALNGQVLDMALGRSPAEHMTLSRDGNITSINHIDGSIRAYAHVPNAINIERDDQFRTAVLDRDGAITVLDETANPVMRASVAGASGLAFSPRLHAYVTLDSANRELVVLRETGGGDAAPLRLGLKPEGPPITPAAALSVNPANGVIGVLEPGTNRLTRIAVSEGRFQTVDEIALGDGAPLDGLVADATGEWYSTRDGRIVALDAAGTELTDNPFAGQVSTPMFELSQPMDVGRMSEGPDVTPQSTPQTGNNVTVSHAADSEEVGDSHDVTVTLTDSGGAPLAGRSVAYAAAGAHTVTRSVVTDVDGKATASWTGSATGVDQFTAWEDPNGDGVHDLDEAAAVLEVTWIERIAIPTSATLASSANPSRTGKAVTFTMTVSAAGGSAPTGSVRFTDNGTDLGASVPLDASGRARLVTSSLRGGKHRIDATYVPAAGSPFVSSAASLTQTVQCSLLDIGCILNSLLGRTG